MNCSLIQRLRVFSGRQNRPMPVIAMSGATGFLGSHFLFWFLNCRGAAWAIVRGRPAAARAHVMRSLLEKSWTQETSLPDGTASRLRLIRGDMQLPHFGLSTENIEQ